MEAAGRDGEMQIDLPVQRGEHAERAVRIVAGSRADSRGDFALEHQHHSRNHARVVAQLAQNCGRDVERKIADYLYRRVARECREIDREEVGVDDANVCEALLEPRREARVEFHQRQRAAWPRRDFLGQDAEAGSDFDYRVRLDELRRGDDSVGDARLVKKFCPRDFAGRTPARASAGAGRDAVSSMLRDFRAVAIGTESKCEIGFRIDA